MKIKNVALYLAVTILALSTSCKKEEEEPASAAPTNTEKLVDGSPWVTTAYTLTSNGQETDWFSTWPGCDQDDLVYFHADGTAVSTEGESSCYGSANDTIYTGTWSFALNETEIVIDGDSYTIANLSSTELKIQESEDYYGMPVLFEQTMVPN